MNKFLPEGSTALGHEEKTTYTKAEIYSAYESGKIFESRVLLCDTAHNLHVDLGGMKGIIPREQGALGIADGSVRDIALITRVNKKTCFTIIGFRKNAWGEDVAILSRLQVQRRCKSEYINTLRPGDIIDAKVTHLERFGAFVDIGAGINALIPIDMISVSRIPHPGERFSEGDDIKVVVRSIDDGKITLSHRELLGTWEENAAQFRAGETVPGIVRSVESYGIFVELTPNLAGLAEEVPNVFAGQHACVYIKSIIPEKMKIKLVVVDSFCANDAVNHNKYFYRGQRMDYWRYSPQECQKVIDTSFLDK